MGKYDTGSKKVIHIYNQAWAEWVLQQQQIKVEEELSSEFQFIARSNDSLLKVKGKDGQFLALTELQFVYDKTMPERLAAYKLLAYQKYNLKVFVTVVYFLSPAEGEEVKTAYNDEFMGQLTHVDFRVIKLWELEAEQVLRYGNPMLLPFVPLMRGGGAEEIIRKCAQRIRQEPEAAELEAILAIFAGYVLDAETIRQIVRWEMPIVQESPIIQELREVWIEEGIEEGIERGIERGIEKGERKAKIESLGQILAIRFDVVLGKFDQQFERLDMQSLNKLVEIALTADSLSKFEKKLTKAIPRGKENSQ